MTDLVLQAQKILEEKHEKQRMESENHRNGWVIITTDGKLSTFWEQACFAAMRSHHDVSVIVNSQRTFYNVTGQGGPRAEEMAHVLLDYFKPFFVEGVPYDDFTKGCAIDLTKVNSIGLGCILMSLRNTQEHDIAETFFHFLDMGLTIPQAFHMCLLVQVDEEGGGYSVRNHVWHGVLTNLSSFLQTQNVLQQIDHVGLMTYKQMEGNCTKQPYWFADYSGIDGYFSKMVRKVWIPEGKTFFNQFRNKRGDVNPFTQKLQAPISFSQLKEML